MALGVAVALLFVFFAMGLHVAVTLGFIGFALMFFFSDRPLWDILGQVGWNTNTNFLLVSIPLFIMMGEIMVRSGIAERVYKVLSDWLAPVPGGMLHANIASCAIFAATSGSSAATAATIGTVALPSFLARGYSERLVTGSLAAGGTLGILIPPSIAFIIYGVLAEESIGRLYMAGFTPGFLLAGFFMLTIAIIAWIWPSTAPPETAPPLRVRVIGLLALLPMFVLVFVVLGTIYLGVATVVEASGFGVVGALLLAAVNRQVNPRMLQEVLLSTVRTSSMLMLIITAAFILSFTMGILRIPAQLSDWVISMNLSPVTFVILLVIFYIILGSFMESFSMMVTTIPIIVPVLNTMGVDLVWFGVIMVLLLEAALISPPEGVNLYVIHGIRRTVRMERGLESKGTMVDLWIGVLPFMLAIIAVLALVVAFPEIALWLPNLVKGAR